MGRYTEEILKIFRLFNVLPTIHQLTIPDVSEVSISDNIKDLYYFEPTKQFYRYDKTKFVIMSNDDLIDFINDTSGLTETLENKTLTTPVMASFYQDAAKTKLMSVPAVSSDTLATLAAAQTFTNKTLTSPKINENVALTSTATQLNKAGAKAASASRLYNLGTPVVADLDKIVVSANMKVGAYTKAADPDVPRNITVKVITVGTADTMGTIVVVGTNYADEAITETITPVSGATVEGIKAFKTTTSVTGEGWVIDAVEGTADTIEVGVGNELGLPLALSAATQMIFGILGTTITAHNPTIAVVPTICETTIDMSAGTYNGSKAALVFVVD